MKKTRQVSYIDPVSGKQIVKMVDIPPPAKVTTLGSGAEVQEVESMEALTALWAQDIISDLVTPLTAHSRQVLSEELKKSLTESDEHQAIDALAQTWKVPDDVALKVLGRLAKAVQKQKQKRGKTVSKTVVLNHQNGILQERLVRLEEENKTLHLDVAKVVNERDALKAHANQRVDFSRQDREAREAREALRQEMDHHRCSQVRLTQTEQALTQALTEGAAVKEERDALLRDAERNLEIALTDYETQVTGKLASVASEHNKKALEVKDLQEEISKLKGERNILKSKPAQVKKECDMSENENVSVNEIETLKAGDEVYCKVSGEGPFVLMTQVEEALVEYANPISNKKNSFNCGKLPIYNAWLVRCKDATMRTLPAPALTKERPKSSMSFGGVKALVTSDVTSKMFQAAIWISMLTLLYMRG